MTAGEFWDWFKENQAGYLFLNEIEDEEEYSRLIDAMLEKVLSYCPGLYFELGGDPYDDQEVIFSASGNVELFDKVVELVESAPVIKNWRFIAFKPPLGPDFKISFDGLELDPREMWFQPMEHPDLSDAIGIMIGIEDLDEDREDEILAASYIVLDTLLGEKSSALDIDYVDITNTPEDPEEEGFFSLSKLAEYIEWKKGNNRNNSPDRIAK